MASPRLAFAAYVLCCATFVGAFAARGDYGSMVRRFGDNPAYLTIARAAAGGRFTGPDLDEFRQFYRGTSYVVAVVARVLRVPVEVAMPIVTLLCGAVMVYFCGRLWGWTVAAVASFVDVALTQRICLGGAEPLFLALLFASMWQWRRGRPLAAALLAALATTVRPTGVFLLAAIGVALIGERRWRVLALSVGVGTAIGALYLLPFLTRADLSAPATGYARDWYGPSPIGVPFVPLVRRALVPGEPVANFIKNGFYLALTVAGFVGVWRRRKFCVESMFFVVFALFCWSYNSPWAWAEYARFSSPIVPQSVSYLSLRRVELWMLPLAVVFGLLAFACSIDVRALL